MKKLETPFQNVWQFLWISLTDEIKVDALDKPHVAQIVSFSVWGVLRGLETFSQLVYTADEHGGTVSKVVHSAQVEISCCYLRAPVIDVRLTIFSIKSTAQRFSTALASLIVEYSLTHLAIFFRKESFSTILIWWRWTRWMSFIGIWRMTQHFPTRAPPFQTWG